MRRLPLALVLLLLAPAVAAQVYTWTDSHGTVHYSETPPPQGTQYKRISSSGVEQPVSATPAPTPPPAKAAAASPASTGELPNTPENRTKVCSSLKANLDLLKGEEGVVLEQDGQSVPLDDTQRSQQIALAEQQYSQYCSQ
ncbi:DUF4124 domain-containing protein [Frateuria sp. STR12]|uniref:DUF4124 domain-containing protein n=1 Tax=Frateuria hangzhouensis TaxID=2995589 RepID=UPI0022608C89|nr:DUF4124 domain-containing protein [Frateuria sp. STR12]MCX7513806.1 DUF4124 domain-containing protein [Frateuria sp. STR12]